MNANGTLPTRPPDRAPAAADRTSSLMLAWFWLCTVPLFFFAGFIAAHLPYAWSGREEGEPGPWWFDLLVVVLLFGVTWLPVGASLLVGRRALRAGSRAAWVPVGIGLLLTAGAAVVLVVGMFG